MMSEIKPEKIELEESLQELLNHGMGSDLHSHSNPKKKINYKKAVRDMSWLLPYSLGYYLIKKTFPETLIKSTIRSESIIWPEYLEFLKSKKIIVPALDHDDCLMNERYKMSKKLGIPFGGEFTVKMNKDKLTHITVNGINLDEYKKLLELRENFDDFVEYASEINSRKGKIAIWAHPFSVTNRDSIPINKLDVLEKWDGPVEINISHGSEAYITTIASLVKGNKIVATTDSHNPETLGKAATIVEGSKDFYDIVNGIKYDDARLFFKLENKDDVVDRIKTVFSYHLKNMADELRLPNFSKKMGKKFIEKMIENGVNSYYNGVAQKNSNVLEEEVKNYFSNLNPNEKEIVLKRSHDFYEKNKYLGGFSENKDYFKKLDDFVIWMEDEYKKSLENLPVIIYHSNVLQPTMK